MAGNDVPLDVLLDRTVQQLEHAEALADRRGELLDRLFAAVVYGMSARLIPSDAIGRGLLDEVAEELADE
jgi:hypothetical protein